jgi:hypothetical protein
MPAAAREGKLAGKAQPCGCPRQDRPLEADERAILVMADAQRGSGSEGGSINSPVSAPIGDVQNRPGPEYARARSNQRQCGRRKPERSCSDKEATAGGLQMLIETMCNMDKTRA